MFFSNTERNSEFKLLLTKEETLKISVADLKKVVKWVEANSNDTHVNVYLIDNFVIQTKDKYEAQVELILYEDSSMLPKIKKVDFL